MFYLVGILGASNPENRISSNPKRTAAWRQGDEPGYIEVLQQGQKVWTSKRSVSQSVQSLSRVPLWDPMDCSIPGLPVHHQVPEFTQTHVTESMMPPNYLILCHLLLLLSIIPRIRVFSSESVLHIRWPKYWSFSLSISPSIEYSAIISFRMDWLDLLTLQGTLKSLLPTLQFKSIVSSVLSFVYSPTLTSIHDYWKNHSFD